MIIIEILLIAVAIQLGLGWLVLVIVGLGAVFHVIKFIDDAQVSTAKNKIAEQNRLNKLSKVGANESDSTIGLL